MFLRKLIYQRNYARLWQHLFLRKSRRNCFFNVFVGAEFVRIVMVETARIIFGGLG